MQMYISELAKISREKRSIKWGIQGKKRGEVGGVGEEKT